MHDQALKSIDDYEVFLTEKITPWSPLQHVALATSIAERWLPAYESFSATEGWGDPASLRRSLEAVWGHVEGRTLADVDAARYIDQIEDITPHMDDFDAEEALTACAILTDALRACGDPQNTIPYVSRTALGVLEGLVQEWPIEPAAQLRVWQKSAVRKEVQAQLKLIEEIDAVTTFNRETVDALRSRIGGLKVKGPARPKIKSSPGLTNQTAFEQYRRFVESDLKGQVKRQCELAESSYLFALAYLGYWIGRYSRRRQTIDGSYGRLADELGQRALVARNRARDAAETGQPEWDNAVREAIEFSLRNNSLLNVVDAGSVLRPHAYGPSLRRLWLEGRRLGQSDQDGWKHIQAWASHRPTAWEFEDRRKKKGLAQSTPELGEALARKLTWGSTDDPAHPWATDVDAHCWRVRINDFPDEVMYSMIIGSQNAGDFHDWPDTWRRTR